MMTTMKTIFARRSYRGPYLPEPVPRQDLRLMMEAGLDAPSGCNKQTCSLIAVDDPELMQRLLAVMDPPVGETAPACICVLTQRVVAYGDKCYAVQDYAAAIENILLAATSMGYASCWYEGHVTDEDGLGRKMADILDVPEDYELVCFLPIGKPAERVRPVSKKAFAERAWFNGFHANP